MKLCRDVVLRQGYPPEELLYIDEKKDKFLVPCTGVFQREKARLERFVFLGIRWKKEAEDKSGKIKAEKITGPDSMIVYKDNLFLRHLGNGNLAELPENSGADTGLLDKETGSR